MFELTDIIIFLAVMITVILIMLAVLSSLKKNFFTRRTHIFRGYSKKKRRFLKADSEIIKQAYWKVEFWEVLCGVSVAILLGTALMPFFLRNFNLAVSLLFVSSCLPVIILSAVMARKRLKEFYRLVEDAGLEFEYNDKKVKEASRKFLEDFYTAKFLGIPYVFIFAFVVLILTIYSVINFVGGNIVVVILFGALAILNVPNLLKMIKLYKAQKVAKNEKTDNCN